MDSLSLFDIKSDNSNSSLSLKKKGNYYFHLNLQNELTIITEGVIGFLSIYLCQFLGTRAPVHQQQVSSAFKLRGIYSVGS